MRCGALIIFIFGLVFHSGDVAALQKLSPPECKKLEQDQKKVVRLACIDDKVYEIVYRPKKNSILLRFAGKESVLARIPTRFNPELVGSDSFIGFLEPRLQAYKDLKFLLYVTTMRTSGGDGRGQCGSGSEIFLNFLDISTTYPKKHSSILIGSCDESIEIDDQSISDGELGKIFIDSGKLRMKFFNYKKLDGSPVGTIADDFKKLNFE